MSRKKTQHLAIGPLSPKGKGKHWVEPKHNFPAPVTICNASSTGLYAGPRWNIRPGAELHKQYPSRGIRC